MCCQALQGALQGLARGALEEENGNSSVGGRYGRGAQSGVLAGGSVALHACSVHPPLTLQGRHQVVAHSSAVSLFSLVRASCSS